jgi:NTE family protein
VTVAVDARDRRRAVALLTLFLLLLPLPGRAACSPPSASGVLPMALVLSGGGAKGAYEAGVAAELLARGAPIRLVAGSSAGALNAAMIADGRIDRLQSVWQSITREQVYMLRPSIVFGGFLPGWLTLLTLNRAGSLFDAAPLRALIADTVDFARVRASPIRVLVVTADLARRDTRLFDNATLTADALLAASAVPGAFAPVEVDGALLSDGGLTGRAPVLDALAHGVPVARALVIMSYATEERGERPTTLRVALEQAFEMAMVHQVRRDTELARLKYPTVDVQLLTPSAPLHLTPLGFEPAGIARALELGKRDGAACADAWGAREDAR